MTAPVQLTPDQWQQHPFVRYLAAEHLGTLKSCAMPVRFEAGQIIFREGDPANRFYLVLDGAVALHTRGLEETDTLIALLGGGDVLGWSWLFPPYQWHFDATAQETTQAVFFYGTWLRQLAEEQHELGYELMRRMAEVLMRRLQATRRQILFPNEPGKPTGVESREHKRPAGD